MAKRLYAGRSLPARGSRGQGMTGCKAWCPLPQRVCGHVDGEHERERPEERRFVYGKGERGMGQLTSPKWTPAQGRPSPTGAGRCC